MLDRHHDHDNMELLSRLRTKRDNIKKRLKRAQKKQQQRQEAQESASLTRAEPEAIDQELESTLPQAPRAEPEAIDQELESTLPQAPRAEPEAIDQELESRLPNTRSEPPDHIVCCITGELMKDPVMCSDGHSYERQAIENWFQNNDTSPLTGARLDHKMLLPNHALRKGAEEWEGLDYSKNPPGLGP